MPESRKPLEGGSPTRRSPMRGFNPALNMGTISYESIRHKVANMKEHALELKEKIDNCERTMSNVEDGLEKLQERMKQLQN